jgi:nucleoside-diphosphate-sugar epimerase
VAWVAAAASSLGAALTRRPAMMSLDKARELREVAWTCDAARARRELGWSPRFGLAEGMADAIAGSRGASRR